jgi:D-glycero-D-manno-heptose 1,7-bisphosphate phosphatase
MTVDPEHGTIDSPLHPDQVRIVSGASEALSILTKAGYSLSIVSNQPAAAKGKTTEDNLRRTHEKVLELVQAKGGVIKSSHLCFHRQEDGCSCRKPRTGLLEDAFRSNPGFTKEASWIVGDGLVDMEAGQKFGVRTVFLAPRKPDAIRLLDEHDLHPTLWFEKLGEFVDHLKKSGGKTE